MGELDQVAIIMVTSIYAVIQWWFLIYINHVLDVIRLTKKSYNICMKDLSQLYVESFNSKNRELVSLHSVFMRSYINYLDDLKLLGNLGYDCGFDNLKEKTKNLKDLNIMFDNGKNDHKKASEIIKKSFVFFENTRKELNNSSKELLLG